ncbi:MAG: UDP-N-acetylglucosamine 2-epimerase [Candidatus Omnitrophota bacterium]|nr:UDP-N-acetylglucosamine 2-epimerase [Candidatus Omnitrophota bacterium]
MNSINKSIILLTDGSDIKNAVVLYDKLVNAGKNPMVLAQDNVDIAYKRYAAKKFNHYKDFFHTSYADIRRDAHDLFYSLAEKEVCEGLKLRDLTAYKGVSLWNVSVQHVFSELLPILYKINMAYTVLDIENPSEVHCINSSSKLGRIFKLVCEKKQIPFFVYEKVNRDKLYLSWVFRRFIVFARTLKRFLVNLKFLSSNLAKFKKGRKKCKVIFFTSVKRCFDSILPVILKYNDEERLVVDTFSSECSARLKENRIFYMDFNGYKPYILFNPHVKRLLKEIKGAIRKNSSFYKDLLYKEVSIGSFMEDVMEEAICRIFPNSAYNIDVMRGIISRYEPRLIVVANYSADIILTAKSMSMPVVHMQNGFINELYFFGPVVTDVITVDGVYWKEYLLKRQAFDPDKVLVTGPAKYDVMVSDRFNIKESNISDGSKKTVVFATNHTELDIGMVAYEAIEQLKAVCNAMNNIKEAHLIIKIHPYEKDLNMYKNTIKEAGLSDYTINQHAEMLKLLRGCHLLITHLSTVGYEAILLDKAVISLSGSSNFEGEDVWDFNRCHAAIIVNDLKDLEGCIRDALFDKDTINKLNNGRKAYLNEHAYRLDGKASDRVKEIVDSFIKN